MNGLDGARHQPGGVVAPHAGGEHQVSGDELRVFRQVGELQLPLGHQGEIPLQHGGRVGPGNERPHLQGGVRYRDHGGPVGARLLDDAHQIPGLVHHAVSGLDALLRALAEGEGGGPVGTAPGGDGGGLKVKFSALLPQPQQRPQPLVLLAVRLALPGLGLQLGDLLPQPGIFRLELIVLKGVVIDPLRPAGEGGDPIADGGGDHPQYVGQGVGHPLEHIGAHRRDGGEQHGDDQD